MQKTLCTINEVYKGQSVVDGAGVKINRLIGSYKLGDIDPFVLLDEIRSDNPEDYRAGFPTHPHRGIETITYMIEGSFRHRDSRGGGGLLTGGSVQWMTAGKGILHSEMPEDSGDGRLWGYQLWLSLPKKNKMVEPRYQHISPEDIPHVDAGGTSVRIISGEFDGSRGPASNLVKSHYFDVRLSAGSTFEFGVEPDMNSFLYVHTGSLKVCNREVGRKTLARFEQGTNVEIQGTSDGDGFLFIAGVPNDEPIVRGGPFVMNTAEEIRQAFDDYRNGTLF